MLLTFHWLVFSSSVQLQLYFIKTSTTIWGTEEKYDLPFLLIASQKYFFFVLAMTLLHLLHICLVQFLIIPDLSIQVVYHSMGTVLPGSYVLSLITAFTLLRANLAQLPQGSKISTSLIPLFTQANSLT